MSPSPGLDISGVSARLVKVETEQEEMHHRLYGNGQPGDIANMSKKIEELQSWMLRATGAVGVIVILVEHFWK